MRLLIILTLTLPGAQFFPLSLYVCFSYHPVHVKGLESVKWKGTKCIQSAF